MTTTDVVCFDCFGAGCDRCEGSGRDPSTAVAKPEVPTAAVPPMPPPPDDEGPTQPHYEQHVQPLEPRQPEPAAPPEVRVVTVEDFAAVDEPGADALLGGPDEVLIPVNGDVMFYGDGGAGKTTLTVDMAAHLAAGDDWLGIPVGRPLTVLMIENEGPRPLFRTKLRAKLDAWTGSPLGGRLRIVDTPWATLTFAQDHYRQALADVVAANDTDVLIIGPVTRSGMTEAGTLEEVRQFTDLIADVRRRAGRPVCVVLVHHENKANGVSGAWEGATDTLLHLTGQGHGRTRLFIQKARWSATHHATTMQLLWTDGAGFAVDDKPELDDDAIAENILTVVGEHPGLGWSAVERLTPGVGKQRRTEIRDRLLTTGQLVNVGRIDRADVLLDHCPPRRQARLHLPDDPTITHLAPESGADGGQLALGGAQGADRQLPPAPRPIRGQEQGQNPHPPDQGLEP